MAENKSKEEKKSIKRVAKSQVGGFVEFVRSQGVVGLAVGLVLGVAAKGVVDSLVNNIFNPIIGLLTGGVNLSDKYFCMAYSGGDCTNALRYGQLVSDVMSFLIAALVIYILVKGLKLDKIDKKKD